MPSSSERKELVEGTENCLFTVAVHHFLKAPLAQTRRTHLAAQVADNQFRRAAIGAQHRCQIFAGLILVHIFDGGNMQAFLVDLSRLAPAAARHWPADVALMR